MPTAYPDTFARSCLCMSAPAKRAASARHSSNSSRRDNDQHTGVRSASVSRCCARYTSGHCGTKSRELQFRVERGNARLAETAFLVQFIDISDINNYSINATNIAMISPWIAERTLTRQEPGCNRRNLQDETNSWKTQRLIWIACSISARRKE